MKNLFRIIITFVIQYEAQLVLKKYKPKIIAIVGSVGKTSVKDAVYTALSTSFYIRKSEKSFNSEIGVPLTILGCQNAWLNPVLWIKNIFDGLTLIFFKNNFPEILVLEVGADHPGDIEKISKWLKPDVVIVTRLPNIPVHVEFFDSPEDVIKEKLSIINYLRRNGTLVVNGDDEKIIEGISKFEDISKITYGLENNNDITASNYAISYRNKIPKGIRFNVNSDNKSVRVEIERALGRPHVYPVLAAVAVASLYEINLGEVGDLFKEYNTPPGRIKLIEGIKGSLIIDDTYNSSPTAVEEAFLVLENIKKEGKKIAVLGDMLELGKYSIDEHRKVGKELVGICDELITIGVRARDIAKSALENGMLEKNIFQYDNAEIAGEELKNRISEKDIILIKGSQSIRMEKTVEKIMAHPEQKKELLVRQDEEWLKR